MSCKNSATTDVFYVKHFQHVKSLLLAILCLAVLINLQACGGSVSEAENQPDPVEQPDNSPIPPSGPAVTGDELDQLPTVNVGARQFADANVLVTLNGVVEAAEGAQIVRTLWVQTGGTEVRIADPTSIRTMIVIPDVVGSAQLEFRLFAEDSEGRVNSATTSVVVVPQPVFARVVGGVVNEADGEVVFRVRLNVPATEPVVILYRTREGTALVESDFVPVEGMLTFDVGDREQEIAVSVVDDSESEELEMFRFQISHISTGTAFSNSGVAVINDNDFLLRQIIQFENTGPLGVLIDAVISNPIVDNPELAPGTGAITYSSSNVAVASVDASGTVIPLAAGSTIITATKAADSLYGEATASYELTVEGLLPLAVFFVQPDMTVGMNAGVASNPLAESSLLGSTGAVTYESSNPIVATVDGLGIVTGGSETGSVTITATVESDGVYESSSATYVLTVVESNTPILEAYIKASNAEQDDQFGGSVGNRGMYFDNDVLVLGAAFEDSFFQGQPLESDNTVPDSGAAYVFRRSFSQWAQEAFLKAPSGLSSDGFGHDVAVAGDVIAVSAPFANGTGTVYIFRFDIELNSWIFSAEVSPPTSGILSFGSSIVMNSAGDVIAVAAPSLDQTPLPSVYVYRFSGTSWDFEATLLPPNSEAGDGFGEALAMEGDTIVVGAPFEDSALSGINSGDGSDNDALDSGAVYIFERVDGSWSPNYYIKHQSNFADINMGTDVAIDGTRLAIADRSDVESGIGYRIYQQQNGVWTQGTQVIYGDSIAMENNLLVIGRLDSEVFINRLNQEGLYTSINSIPAQSGNFAQTLGVSGYVVAVGAPLDDTGATGVGSIIPTDAAAPNSGAVHTYCVDLATDCLPPP